MQEKDHIKELFNETFANYEVPVRPELWNQLSTKLGTAPSPSVDPTIAVEAITTTSQISGSLLTWIAGVAFIATTVVGVLIYQSGQDDSTTNNESGQVITTDSDNSENHTTIETPNSIEKMDHSGIQHRATTVHSNTQDNISSEKVSIDLVTPAQSSPIQQSVSSTHIAIPETNSNSTNGNPQEKNSTESAALVTETGSGSEATSAKRLKADPLIGTAPLTVSFYPNSDDESAEWNFGDGQVSKVSGKVEHIFNTPGSYEVQLKSTDKQGYQTTEKIKIQVLANLTIHNIPNIFTPNQDGLNDFFTFEATQFADIEVNIYDKSGKFVHRFTDVEKGWDGKLNTGQEAPEGTYFYIIFAASELHQKHQQKGTITLKR